ncbi:hypothetical protein VTK73DRAFT_8300 [Phialemonium thermophilum]|uniref:Uncharacterized protein n=1 Tax=Phialemonium thermophilum TaxID=223376 RepID=A0ABR3W932_9PEZI
MAGDDERLVVAVLGLERGVCKADNNKNSPIATFGLGSRLSGRWGNSMRMDKMRNKSRCVNRVTYWAAVSYSVFPGGTGYGRNGQITGLTSHMLINWERVSSLPLSYHQQQQKEKTGAASCRAQTPPVPNSQPEELTLPLTVPAFASARGSSSQGSMRTPYSFGLLCMLQDGCWRSSLSALLFQVHGPHRASHTTQVP